MTQENSNQLLLKDLCARLPYHIRVKVWLKDGTTEEGTLDLEHNYGDVLRDAFYYNKIVKIKPYLRPISSMTETQKNEYQYITERWMYDSSYSISDSIDWLNKNHFDYRGLIPMGLTIAVTKENNPYKK